MKDWVWFGRPAWEIVAWVVFICIILWGVKQEYRESHCYDGLRECGKVWEWDPKPGDGVADLIRRIEFGNSAENYVIVRRITMIAAAGLTFIIMWFFNKKQTIPRITEFLVLFVLVMGIIWFTFRYHESHYLDEIDRRTQLSIQELKYQTGVAVRPTNMNI